jgi:hypothetical protein
LNAQLNSILFESPSLGEAMTKLRLAQQQAEDFISDIERALRPNPHFSQFGLKLRRLLQLCGRRARGARDVGAEGAAGDLVFCGSPWAFG